MQYRIIETTDGQHLGEVVTIIPGQTLVEMEDGDVFRIRRLSSSGGYTRMVSFNYIAIMMALGE